MSEERKFKLDELSDEGSSPVPQKATKKTRNVELVEPRIKRLNSLDALSKIGLMKQSWSFDHRELNHGWIGFALVLGILELTLIYENYILELQIMDENFFDFGGVLVREFTFILESFIRHPILLMIFAPLFFRFSHSTEYKFKITFDGIDTVKVVLPKGSKELVSRTFVKWKIISEVRLEQVGGKEILKLYSVEGHIADIIWYINSDKKSAIKRILKGMILPDHPMRHFLENEKELP